jgi:hypothetical protein
MAQDPTFHNFADIRSLWTIPNFANVVSNLPFLIIGSCGLAIVSKATVPSGIRWTYWILFAGVVLTGLGSAFYHLHPNNDTLVWDRIPMTIVFMSFLAATVAELASQRVGVRLLLPLVIIGISSVLWWHYTETIGRGDLRLYFWVQYYPMLAIPLLLWLYYSPVVKTIVPSLIWIMAWYIIAKVFEQLAHPIYNLLGVSGHSLKHLAAAVSTIYFIKLFTVKYVNTRAAIAPA